MHPASIGSLVKIPLHLNYKNHKDEIIDDEGIISSYCMFHRLSRIIGAAYSMRDMLSLHAAKTFYYSMFQSLLTYIIVIWGGSLKTAINTLQISQNKIIRLLFAELIPHRSTSDIFKFLHILNVQNLYKLELGKLMYNTLYHDKYKLLKTQLTNLEWSHNFNTRKINAYRLPYSRTCIDHGAVLFASVAFWNSFPLEAHRSQNRKSFKKCLIKYMCQD